MQLHTHLRTRRQWLQQAGCGFGGLALGALAAANADDDDYTPSSHKKPERPKEKPRGRHHVPRAKRVIFLFMPGGPSQLDTFDYKPRHARKAGASASGGLRKGQRAQDSPFEFKHYGESGLPISEVFANVANHADDLCLLNAMETASSSHTAAESSFHNGGGNRSSYELPSLGAWSCYGLGNSGSTLPGYLTINYNGSARNFGLGFLPSKYQGVRLEVGTQRRQFYGEEGGGTANVTNRHYTPRGQRRQLDLVQRLNKGFADSLGGADEIDAVIESFEQGYDMQGTFNTLLDATSADAATQKLYGIDEDHTAPFGEQCLIARRMAEGGVPFIQLNHSSPRQGALVWDHHNSLEKNLRLSAAEIDKPIAGLLTDLKQRGMLDETLVVWGGEFGRTPEGRDGRNHQNRGFTMWMAGGGIRGGIRHGATDEKGGAIADGRTTINDLHATILYQLGFDPARLAYKQAKRELYSEAKNGGVIPEIIA